MKCLTMCRLGNLAPYPVHPPCLAASLTHHPLRRQAQGACASVPHGPVGGDASGPCRGGYPPPDATIPPGGRVRKGHRVGERSSFETQGAERRAKASGDDGPLYAINRFKFFRALSFSIRHRTSWTDPCCALGFKSDRTSTVGVWGLSWELGGGRPTRGEGNFRSSGTHVFGESIWQSTG